MIKQYDHLIKLILIGSSGVGKSSVLTQFVENKFTTNYLTTIGVDFKQLQHRLSFRFKTLKHDGKNIKFQIWDTAGQERFRTITATYYKGAEGIIMVYDVTDPSSLQDIENFWIPEANSYCQRETKVLLFGNKTDVQNPDKKVNPQVIFNVISQKVRILAEKYGFETVVGSAKSADQVCSSITNFGIKVVQSKIQKNLITPGNSSSIRQSNPVNQDKNNKSEKVTITQKSNQGLSQSYRTKCC